MTVPAPVELRLRNWISEADLDAKVGRILTPGDFNVLCTGPVRLYRPAGDLLAVYLPGVLTETLGDAWPVLSSIRIMTDNRGKASGTPREQRGDQKRTRTRRVLSSIVGAVDPGPAVSRAAGRLPVCRLTAWTGKHLPEWQSLHPVFKAIDGHYAVQVPERYRYQREAAARTHPDWRIPKTAFTTVTVNNTYSTGVHQDAGDLPEGFSTLAVARRGDYRGGHLVLPRYRVAFDMHDGDLLMFDAHEWHGNTAMWCPHQAEALARPCPKGCERVSLVTYFRTKVQACDSAEAEHAKALAAAEAS
jgi:2-oxoglutarate-Fe(II)-dependent dioxygenase family protein